MIIKKISLLSIVLLSVFSQSLCMHILPRNERMQTGLRDQVSRQWTFDPSKQNFLPALKDYTRKNRNFDVLVSCAWASVALVGAVAAWQTSWFYTGSVIAGTALSCSVTDITDALVAHKRLGILNDDANLERNKEYITKIGQDALYASMREMKVKELTGNTKFDAEKVKLKPVGYEERLPWVNFIKKPKGFKSVLEGTRNNEKWTLMQEE